MVIRANVRKVFWGIVFLVSVYVVCVAIREPANDAGSVLDRVSFTLAVWSLIPRLALSAVGARCVSRLSATMAETVYFELVTPCLCRCFRTHGIDCSVFSIHHCAMIRAEMIRNENT
jgi:hypothetical protein